MDWVVGDADKPRSGDVGRGLGATTETETMVLTRTRTIKQKKAVLVSVWLKESY